MALTQQRESAENSSDSDVSRSAPPDGGWGWMIVFSSFMIHFIADGVTYTFGIFYVALLHYFGESKGSTAWVASIMVGTTYCIGPVASGLTNKYGCRAVTVGGSLLAASGLLLSVLAPNIVYLYFTIGLCTGSGFGLMYLPSIVSVTWYFEKKRAFATGIAVCGAGIGTFAFAPLIEYLVEDYGWKGAMLIISGLVLNCCVFGALLRSLESKPLPKGPEKLENSKSWQLEKLEPNGNYPFHREIAGSQSDIHLKVSDGTVRLTRPKSEMIPEALEKEAILHKDNHLLPTGDHTSLIMHKDASRGVMYRKDIFCSGSFLDIREHRSNPSLYKTGSETIRSRTEEKTRRRCCPRELSEAFDMLDASLIKDAVFLMFGLSNFLTSIGFSVPYVYTKDRANGLGIAEAESSFLLSVIGISNTIGRVIFGLISDRKWVNRLFVYNISLTISGLATAFSSYCYDYISLVVYSAIFGVTTGAYISLTSVILVDFLGLERLTNALGLLLMFQGIASFIGPPITGFLYDWTGSYNPGFDMAGAVIAISGIMLFFVPCFKRAIHRGPKADEETAAEA